LWDSNFAGERGFLISSHDLILRFCRKRSDGVSVNLSESIANTGDATKMLTIIKSCSVMGGTLYVTF